MEVIETKDEFKLLSAEEVWNALRDNNHANPIAIECARLIEGYTRNFVRHAESLGHFPDKILRSKSAFAIEEIAMTLTTQQIRAGLTALSLKD